MAKPPSQWKLWNKWNKGSHRSSLVFVALEYRYNQHQRIAFLVRWDKENCKYVCISMFGGVEARARYETIPDAFEILLGDDDMFGGYVFRPDLKDLDSAKEAAKTVRTCMELLN
ncbi:MAG: hypothetical protein WCB11_28790 [Terriglobales bacterium]